MSVIDIKNIQALKNTRQFSAQKFKVEQLRSVAQHPILSDGEKLFWLMMAQRPAPYRQKMFQISDVKIAHLIGEKILKVPAIIKRMESLGFIEINYQDFLSPRYKLSLPDNDTPGLLKDPYVSDKHGLISKVQRKISKIYLNCLAMFKLKILRRNTHKSYANSYLGNYNLLAIKYDSQLQLALI